MILRFLGWRGIAGIAACAVLVGLFLIQRAETRHWKKQSARHEQLYRAEQSALAGTIANYRAATEAARTADRAHAERVAAEQRAINERTLDDYQTRLAAARARADGLRQQARVTTDRGSRRSSPMPPISIAAGGAAQAAGEDRLPPEDALIATEQAIQLDELVKWVRAQARIDPNAKK